MITGDFDYYDPQTVEQAIALLQEHGSAAKILAGGQSLIPAMRFRLAMPEVLIDINGIDGLDYVREENGHLAIGGLTRETHLEASALVSERYPMLADTARVIADPLVRNRATVGGNLAHADPANDHPATMLAYAAEITARGPNGDRTIAIDDLFVDLFETSLEPDEILTEIRVPSPGPSDGGAYIKMERKIGDYAVSAVAVQLTMDGDTCTRGRIALTNLSSVPMRATDSEAALVGNEIEDEVLEAAGRAAAAQCQPSGDLRGSVEYKRDLTSVLTKRAIKKAVERASGGMS